MEAVSSTGGFCWHGSHAHLSFAVWSNFFYTKAEEPGVDPADACQVS